jgi:hypothetical protein
VATGDLRQAEATTEADLEAARLAFRAYHAACFWSYAPDYVIKASDVRWVAEQLMKHGDRRAWELGASLCR